MGLCASKWGPEPNSYRTLTPSLSSGRTLQEMQLKEKWQQLYAMVPTLNVIAMNIIAVSATKRPMNTIRRAIERVLAACDGEAPLPHCAAVSNSDSLNVGREAPQVVPPETPGLFSAASEMYFTCCSCMQHGGLKTL